MLDIKFNVFNRPVSLSIHFVIYFLPDDPGLNRDSASSAAVCTGGPCITVNAID